MRHVEEEADYLHDQLELVGDYKRLTGMFTLLNMPTPFLASINATSWGVDTMTAPEREQVESGMNSPSTTTSWPKLSCTSPVPGGMSMTKTSRSSPLDVQSTSKRSCCQPKAVCRGSETSRPPAAQPSLPSYLSRPQANRCSDLGLR